MHNTFNIICFGTGESSSQARKTILHEVKDQLSADSTICCEGVTWNARRSFVLHKKQKTTEIVSEDRENQTTTYRQVSSDQHILPGKDDVVEKGVTQIFEWLHQCKPTMDNKIVINFIGFSRGGTFPLRIINEFNKRHPEYVDLIECNVLAIDPVAGFGDKGHASVKTIPRNVNEYLSTIHLHENRGGFEAQDISRLTHIENPMETTVSLLPLPGRHAGITQFSASHSKVGSHELNKSAELLWEIVADFYGAHGAHEFGPKKTLISRKDKHTYAVKREQFTRLTPIEIVKNYDFLSLDESEKSLKAEAYRTKKANGALLPEKMRAAKERLHEYVTDSEYFTNLHHRKSYELAYPHLFNLVFKQQIDEINPIDSLQMELDSMPEVSQKKLMVYLREKYPSEISFTQPNDYQVHVDHLLQAIKPTMVTVPLQRNSSIRSVRSSLSSIDSIVNLPIDEVKESASQKLMLQIRLAFSHYKTDTQLGKGRYIKQCQPFYDQILELSRTTLSDQEKTSVMMALSIKWANWFNQQTLLTEHERTMIKTLAVTLFQDRALFSAEHGIICSEEQDDQIQELQKQCSTRAFRSTPHHYVALNGSQSKSALDIIAEKLLEAIATYKEAKNKTWDNKPIKYFCDKCVGLIYAQLNEKNEHKKIAGLKQICTSLQTQLGHTGSTAKMSFRKKTDTLLNKIKDYEHLSTPQHVETLSSNARKIFQATRAKKNTDWYSNPAVTQFKPRS